MIEPRQEATCTKTFHEFCRMVFEICERTDRHAQSQDFAPFLKKKYEKYQEAFEKRWAHSLLRAVLHCHSPGVATAATVARRLRIDVHDDDDDNDNA